MRRLTTLLAVAAAGAAAIPAAASAEPPYYAGMKPGNYGSCVAYEAMAGNDPVSEFTQRTSPITVFGNEGEKTVGQKNPDGITMGCVIDFGSG